MNKIEQIKQEKDGLAVWSDLESFAADGWENIPEGDLERLKCIGVFHRKATPGFFMMRVRVTHGFLKADQARTLAEIALEFGRDALDLTTRQQVQLRWLEIENIPEVIRRLALVGLSPLQTGMDSIRNVVGCPVAGIDPEEVLDTIPVARSVTRSFIRNVEYTNLPRKFNIALSGCPRDCCHSSSQDVGMAPARDRSGRLGFNVSVGGALGGTDPRFAIPMDLFLRPEEVRTFCLVALDLFREHGPREIRTRSRLKYLLDEWGIERFRSEVEAAMGGELPQAGESLSSGSGEDHLGIHRQTRPGLYYAGLHVPVGRIGGTLLKEVARLAETYGQDQIRLTTQQNLIIPHIEEDRVAAFRGEPVLRELRLNPSPVLRNLVCCTGDDFCHFALIDTKGLAMKLVETLDDTAGWSTPLRIHVSGCPHACGQHRMGDIGLQGAKIRVNGEIVPAADVFVGGRGGADPVLGSEVGAKVPWTDLPGMLTTLGRDLEAARGAELLP